MGAQKKEKTNKDLKVNEAKWSKPLMAAGWTAIPSIIIKRQKALGLDAIDVNIVLHLATYWWKADDKPRPAKKTIATAIGVHPRTVQRHIADMEKGGLIRREAQSSGLGSKPNIYHFDGLIKEALGFAEEELAERKARAEAENKKAGKKGKVKLKVVGGTDAE